MLEKQQTTPDQYPLSLNALRLACNQSTNREPVVDYDEALLRDALRRLERRGLVRFASGVGSRAMKYRHLLADALPMSEGERALMCVLMLRGAQTPGELKQRTERLHAFADLEAVHATLEQLIGRALVQRLARRPGQKEERYGELLTRDGAGGDLTPAAGHAPAPARAADAAIVADGPAATSDAASQPSLQQRVARLEREVAELRAAMRHPVV
jgi:uncharacterized protein YceH (UPF0502 family)